MPNPYERSIFAVELERVLQKHQLALDTFALTRKPLAFDRKTAQRLVESLHHVTPLAALNQVEMITLVQELKITRDEFVGIYAAMLALGVQRIMLTYLPTDRAWEIADETRQAILQSNKIKILSREYLERRVLPSHMTPLVTLPSLDAALEHYDEGTRLHTLGSLMDADEGQILLVQAQAHLQRSVQMLEMLPQETQKSEDWQYWHELVQHQLDEIADELE